MLKLVPKVRRRRNAPVGSSEDTLACERVESARGRVSVVDVAASGFSLTEES